MKNILSLCFIVFTLSACEDFFTATKEIDLGEYTPEVAVMARLVNTDLDTVEDLGTLSHLGVLVSRSRTVLDSSGFSTIQNADVTLTGSDGLDIMLRFDEQSGYYLPTNGSSSEFERISVKENTKYELVVDVPGEELVTSVCETKTFGLVKDINLIQDDIAGDEYTSLDRIQIEIDDPQGENFYLLKVYYESTFEVNGEEQVDINQGYLYNFDSIFDELPELIDDKLFDGKNHTLEFWSERYDGSTQEGIELCTNCPQNQKINKAIVFLWSISKEEYEFRRSLEANYIAQDNPFAEPSIVFSNIENGLGVFSMSKIERFVIPWEE